jgi:hypothetical protein
MSASYETGCPLVCNDHDWYARVHQYLNKADTQVVAGGCVTPDDGVMALELQR